MITIKAKMPSASMEEIKSIADGIEKIGASSRERINLLEMDEGKVSILFLYSVFL